MEENKNKIIQLPKESDIISAEAFIKAVEINLAPNDDGIWHCTVSNGLDKEVNDAKPSK